MLHGDDISLTAEGKGSVILSGIGTYKVEKDGVSSGDEQWAVIVPPSDDGDVESDSESVDDETESDEMFQNAGEKGTLHPDPDDPPRRRANNRPGMGTMENDRPPVLGVVGRTTGQIRLTVCDNTQQATIQPQVEDDTLPNTTLNTDESSAYNHIAGTGRNHYQKKTGR